jgi:protein-tyrosine phosphatase
MVNYLRSMKILMVCLGNICRSPIAEGVLQAKAKAMQLDWIVESAGTNGFHDGEAPHKLSQKVAAKHGINISNQISRKFVAADFERYDKIYVMAADVMQDVKKIAGDKFVENKIDYFLNELNAGKNEDVPDPWYGAEDGYDEVYEMIERTCDSIVRLKG